MHMAFAPPETDRRAPFHTTRGYDAECDIKGLCDHERREIAAGLPKGSASLGVLPSVELFAAAPANLKHPLSARGRRCFRGRLFVGSSPGEGINLSRLDTGERHARHLGC